MANSRSVSLVFIVAAALAVLVLRSSSAFVTGSSSVQLQQRAPSLRHHVIRSAESGSKTSFELPTFEESSENVKSASIVFWFILGLTFPVIHGFTLGLILGAVGWGLSNGQISGFLKKSKSTEEYAGYADQVGEAGEKAGEVALKSYNFVAKKVKELTA
eukprot:TRINITY_DN17427_c0_g2_i1.p1 TRINITY_DN17427_c0_g2~~TRINITY_DN17427_c0_g2_i1.p1  ORF type:complete len:159 (-),score=42.00 TRINITY_DN17427_c0_g2_i1:238-714(-)